MRTHLTSIKQRLFYLVLCMALMLPALQETNAQIFKIPHPDTTIGNAFGSSVAIDGHRALVGASAEKTCGPNSGAAYVFERDSTEGTWSQVARLTPKECVIGDFFGRSLSISGNRAVIAASGSFPSRNASNAAYIFERDEATGAWEEVSKISHKSDIEEGSFAASVSLDGDRVLIATSGDPIRHEYSGAAYIYERNEKGNWVRKARLTGSDSKAFGIFGGSGALDGDYAVVTASMYYKEKPGSLYIFERNPATDKWKEVKRIGGIDDIFISVAMDDRYILAGESLDGSKKSGIATLYERSDDNTWALKQIIKPNVPYKSGAFGSEVSFDGKSALIAGYDEQLGKNFNIDRVVYEFKYSEPLDEWKQRRIFDVGAVDFGTAIAAGGGYALIGQVSDQAPGAAYVVRIR
ncbi:MAG: hypothetical protein AB8G77_21445 [Rhodothermales bacterium]